MAAVPNDIATAKPAAQIAPLSRKAQQKEHQEMKKKKNHRSDIDMHNRPPSPSPPPSPAPAALSSTSAPSKKRKRKAVTIQPVEWTDEERAQAAEKDLGGDGNDRIRKAAWEEVMEGIAEPLAIASMLLERISPGLARHLYALVEKLGEQKKRFPQYSTEHKGALEGTCLHFNMAPGDKDWHTDEKSLYTGYVSVILNLSLLPFNVSNQCI